MKKKSKRATAPARFRPGSTGACESQLWEFRGPEPHDGSNKEPEVHRIAASSLEQALQYILRRHPGFMIANVALVGIIVLVSGSPLD